MIATITYTQAAFVLIVEATLFVLCIYGLTRKGRFIMSGPNTEQQLLHEIEKIACGEKQVADDDGECLNYIYDLIQEFYQKH